MSVPDTPLPPPYTEVSKSNPATTTYWFSPEPELAWYREQCCVFGQPKAAGSSLKEIVINDKTGTACTGTSERLGNLLNEQISRPPRARIRVVGSHYGSGKKKFGSQTDFDIWMYADWLVAPEPSSESPIHGPRVVCKLDQEIHGCMQICAYWMYEDFGRTKVILIEREVVRTVSNRLKDQITEVIRQTNYAGNINISIEVDHDKTLITRQEITSRTKTRFSTKTWPTSFSILRDYPKSDNVMNKLKEDLEDDMCILKAFWPYTDMNIDTSAEGSGSTSRQHESSPQSVQTTKLEEDWLGTWQIPLQNAVIEVKEDGHSGTRALSSKDRNDAEVIGLRRRPPKKTWGAQMFSLKGSKMFRKQ